MGLGATVLCNCFRDGKTMDPPCPREWLQVDADGFFALLPEHDTDELYAQVSAWMEAACEHPGMDAAREWIDGPAIRSLQQALDHAGWDHFPVLRQELPSANGGRTPPGAARKALDEL